MERDELLARLRRLAGSAPGSGLLRLPPGLSAAEAVEAVREAVARLGGRPDPPDARPADRGEGGATIHIDGAARGNPGPAGIGVRIQGADGTLLEEQGRSIGEATNNVAEYRALLLALERAEALGLRDLRIRSDSELLVRQITGGYKVRHPALQPLYAQAMRRIADLQGFEIRHVPRELNGEADALANRGIDQAVRRPGGPRGDAWRESDR